jgi:hypothetical protein
MKKTRLAAVCLLFALVFTGCISFRIIPSYPLEGFVERILFCKDVDESGELLEPQETQNEFQDADESVICFIEIKNISRKIGMRWKWYGPDLTLSRDSGTVIINREERLLEVVTAYDELMLRIREKEEKVGRWTVIVLVNDNLVARKTFEVK